MKKKNLIVLIILIVAIISLIVVSIIYINSRSTNNNSHNNENIIENTNENVIADKEVNNISFKDIKYTYDGESTMVTLEITNNYETPVIIGEYIAKVYDKDNNEIMTFNPIFDTKIKEKSTVYTSFMMKGNYIDAYSMEIELPNLEVLDTIYDDIEITEEE